MAKAAFDIVDSKNYQGLVIAPIDAESEGLITSLGYGPVMAEIKRTRNPGYHNLMMVMLRKIYREIAKEELSEQGFKNFRRYIKINIGHYDLVLAKGGDKYLEIRSWKFDEMDDAEFRAAKEPIIKFILDTYKDRLSKGLLNEIFYF